MNKVSIWKPNEVRVEEAITKRGETGSEVREFKEAPVET